MNFTFNCRGRLLTITQPVVMGIINTTPDSFYAGSRHQATDDALHTAEQMLRDGATFLDIGGQSTRPGSVQLNESEERERVVPIVTAIQKRFPESFLSIDTYHSAVAKAAVEAGASMINDISGGKFDKEMLSTAASLHTPYICMHVEGTAGSMHTVPAYNDIVPDLIDYFVQRIEQCRLAGINDIIIDPGFGFSKTREQNFTLLRKLDAFQILQKPILLGVSRKSTIYKTLGITPEEALNGSTVLHTIGLLKGAAILRVHDVKETMEAIRLVECLG